MSVLHGSFVIDDGQPVAGSLELHTERIDVTTRWERDPDWTAVDKNGHFHAVDAEGKTPTLIAREKHMPCNGNCGGSCGGEGYTKTVYRCAICNAKVKPGIRPGTPRSIAGRMDGRLNVETDVPSGKRVSFRLLDVDGRLVVFGIAEAYAHRSEGGPDGIRSWSDLSVVQMARAKRSLRGPALPHTHDPDGDGTDDCAACDVADDAAAKRREDRA